MHISGKIYVKHRLDSPFSRKAPGSTSNIGSKIECSDRDQPSNLVSFSVRMRQTRIITYGIMVN
jgi:hypothetical protein